MVTKQSNFLTSNQFTNVVQNRSNEMLQTTNAKYHALNLPAQPPMLLICVNVTGSTERAAGAAMPSKRHRRQALMPEMAIRNLPEYRMAVPCKVSPNRRKKNPWLPPLDRT
eukprot:CAMPEP_0197077462 /NCGR_PEP_ID=MMETSP1384-20130603/212633_1 /TAXON_ID=29189 /ORGANISM="Ammonia sp." /LENGTH=110 /DNA_ID=CAMNT_0042516327 /DNA_START=587 /DNA_END=919 /DNA_ORIENTATION=+